MSDTDIEQYLWQYDSLFHYFPFLSLPREWSVIGMRNEHSFWLLGVLAAMSQHELEVNKQLHAQFLRVLAERVIVTGERGPESLDIIRGLLTYIAR